MTGAPRLRTPQWLLLLGALQRRPSIMADEFFDSEGSRVLTANTFRFVLDSELKRAARLHSYLTLVVVRLESNGRRAAAPPGDETVTAIARLIGTGLRTTDVVGRTAPDTVSLVLFDADAEGAGRVIDRVVPAVERFGQTTPISASIGSASYPTHAADTDTLRARASATVTARVATAAAARRTPRVKR